MEDLKENLNSIKELGHELEVRWFNKPITAKRALDRANTLLNITEQVIQSNSEDQERIEQETKKQKRLNKMIESLKSLDINTVIQ